jgi:hypothetical protein
MKEIYVALGFFLLNGLLIFRIIEEHRGEVRRAEFRAREPLALSKEKDLRQT